ncbi:MAG: hypothetical protein HC809_05340 [Gammaproteobacteria bacterium]|nr:hypothetical protein [Gammaproteobacteria bacterium]
MPVFVLGVAMWLATPAHWSALLWAFLTVFFWQVLLHIAIQIVTRRRSLSAAVVDTEQSIEQP